MTIEQKAKAYDVALEKAKQLQHDNAWVTTIFPELAESEDEKIRKLLVRFVRYEMPDNYSDDISKDSCLAYLEKQKEQKSISQNYDEAFDEFMSHIPEKDADGGDTCYNYDDMLSAIQFGIKWQKEQQSAEWSEEDESMLEEVISNISEDYVTADYEEILSWLKTLKYRIQPKQEWDEVDKRLLGKCIDAASGYYNPEDKPVLKDWLKSLPERFSIQQKQAWSEEDEKHFEALVLASERCMGKWHCCNEECGISKHLDWLKSLRPQSYWKPSEEQLNALYDVLNPADEVDKNQLESLYNDLKKLKE